MSARGWRASRIPYVAQMEIAECGSACLAMIAQYYGHGLELSEARKVCGVSRDGANALALLRAAATLGFDTKGMRVQLERLRGLPLPAIIHWGFNHFVVLESVGRHGAVIVDPASGRRRISARELDDNFTGVVLVMTPGPTFRRKKQERVGIGSYFAGLCTHSGAAGVVLVSSLLLELLGVFVPAANQVLVDHVITPGRERWLFPIALSLGVAMVARSAFVWLRQTTLQTLHLALDVQIFTRFMDHLSRLPSSFFQHRTVGDLMERVGANATLRDTLSSLVNASLDVLLVVGYATLMLIYDPRLCAVALAFQAARAVLVLSMRSMTQQATSTELVRRGDERGAAMEALANPEVVHAFGAAPFLERRYSERVARRLNANLETSRLSASVAQGATLIDALGYALLLWVGGHAVIAEQMTPGVFAGFISLHALLAEPLGALVSAYAELHYVRGVLTRLDDVTRTELAPAGDQDPGAMRGAITLRELSFSYGGKRPLLDSVSIDIRPGEKVAIVGRSGEGKSTIVRLLLGLEQPTSGQILFDGRDLGSLDRAKLCGQVGAVMQEPFVMDDTIRANVTFGAKLDDTRVWWALRMACLEDDVRRMPAGLSSPVGECGARLSGGQRQRLVLARALARTPRLLVLDEATSALDTETERRVHDNLRTLSCTRIVIAHRLATVADADRILVLANGRFVQQGSHDSLRHTPGAFAELAGSLS